MCFRCFISGATFCRHGCRLHQVCAAAVAMNLGLRTGAALAAEAMRTSLTVISLKYFYRNLVISMAETARKLSTAEQPIPGEVTVDFPSSEKKRTFEPSCDDAEEVAEEHCKRKKTKATGDHSSSKPRKIIVKRQATGPVCEKPEFYFESGLRKVRPYWFRHVTYAKQRWYGRSLGDVFKEEMNAKDPDYFKQQVELGRVTVNDQHTSVDYIVKNNDAIKNIVHRHEMPVLDTPIEVLLNLDDVVVVNKPSSIPVHPCGRYCFNTLSYLLRHQHGLEGLRITNRLDRMTSGLVIMAKTLSKAQDLALQHAQGDMQKEYICRVEGEFPDHEVLCDQPIDQLFPKMGVRCISPNGKPSRTRFQKLFSEGNQSVVRCILETGRTHQIRVHLQYLGFPIVNDGLYNNEVFGPEKGKGAEYGKSKEQLCKDLAVVFGAESWVDDFDESLASFVARRPPSSLDAPSAKPDPTLPHYDPFCADCHMVSKDPTADQLEMYLHCLKYEDSPRAVQMALDQWQRRYRDICADCYNSWQKWQALNSQAIAIAQWIANDRILLLDSVASSKADPDFEEDAVRDRLSTTYTDQAVPILEKFAGITKKLHKLEIDVHALAKLRGNVNEWNDEQPDLGRLGKLVKLMKRTCKKELECKKAAFNDLTLAGSRDATILGVACFIHQPFVDESDLILMLEAVVIESGHKK